MTVAALRARPLPNYTKTEEVLNSASHFLGAIMGIFVLITCMQKSTSSISLVGSIVYGISMILLYSVSGIYHAVSPKKVLAKQLLRNIDHCTIYVLIAGSYTPVILNILYPQTPVKAIIILCGIWLAAVVGIVVTAIDLEKYSKFSMFCYIALGWFAIFIIKPIAAAIGAEGIFLLVAGGVSYTVGALFYSLGKRRYMHLVFHIFVILGTLLHYICMLNLVIK